MILSEIHTAANRVMPLIETEDKGMRARFLAADGIQVQSGDHDGFTIKTVKGEQRTFLLLRPCPTAVDVTNEVKNGLVWKFDR